MKQSLLLLFLSFCMASCGITKIDSPNFDYKKDLTFKVKASQDLKMIEKMGYNAGYSIAEKGTAHKRMNIEFTNLSNVDQEINFEEFFLLDEANNKYEITLAMQNYSTSFDPENLLFTIGAGKTRSYTLQFHPPFPKDQPIKLLVDGKEIEL